MTIWLDILIGYAVVATAALGFFAYVAHHGSIPLNMAETWIAIAILAGTWPLVLILVIAMLASVLWEYETERIAARVRQRALDTSYGDAVALPQGQISFDAEGGWRVT